MFVASDFVDRDGGSIAVLDDIEVFYEHDPRECQPPARAQAPAPAETSAAASPSATPSFGAPPPQSPPPPPPPPSPPAALPNVDLTSGNARAQPPSPLSASSVDRLSGGGSRARASKTQSVEASRNTPTSMSDLVGDVDIKPAEVCNAVKCTFEDGGCCALPLQAANYEALQAKLVTMRTSKFAILFAASQLTFKLCKANL